MVKLRFREVQRFRQPWIWCPLLASCGLVVGLFGYGMVQQLVIGKPWGDRPMSDIGLSITFVLALAFVGGLIWLFWSMQLLVEVRSEELFIHFKPLKSRIVPYDQITHVEACRYRPIVQYGGWGLRRGRKGWAFNVSGNEGVRLDFPDGTHLLIGSRRPAEMAAAIEAERGA